jgi:hypothetical protein
VTEDLVGGLYTPMAFVLPVRNARSSFACLFLFRHRQNINHSFIQQRAKQERKTTLVHAIA